MDLFANNPAIMAIIKVLMSLFVGLTNPTAQHLVALVLGIYYLNDCKSVRFTYIHFHNLIVKCKLKTLYYTFSKSRMNVDDFSREVSKLGLSLIPYDYVTLPIFFIIDDTMVEKYGKYFPAISKLFDHAAHNGTNYLTGHCFVCLVMVIPLPDVEKGVRYVRYPVGYRLWIPEKGKELTAKGKKSKSKKTKSKKAKNTKKAKSQIEAQNNKSKFVLAVELMQLVLEPTRKFVVLADSWFPKAEVIEFVNSNPNVEAVFNVPKNTVLYDTEVPERTGLRGRPCKIGKKISIEEDFTLIDIKNTDYNVGWRMVTTNLFGKCKSVMAMVTEAKASGSKRLYICTNPEICVVDIKFIEDETMRAIVKSIPQLACFACYTLRWGIEIGFMEQKAYWGFSDYLLRSIKGIERLINVQSIGYAVLCLLPWVDEQFASLKNLSIQERRYEVGRVISHQLFMGNLIRTLESQGNSEQLIAACRKVAEDFKYFDDTGS